MLESIQGWLESVLITSLVVSSLTLLTHWLLRKRSASERLTVCICGTVALLAIGLAPMTPFRLKLPEQAPAWIAHIPQRISLETIPQNATQVPHEVGVIAASTPASLSLEWLPLIYFVAVVILAGRLILGLVGVLRLKTGSQPHAGLVRLSGDISMPVALGGIRPCILMPTEAAAWPEHRLRAVCLHELAHLRNGDWLWLGLANAVSVLFWFNPAVWLLRRHLRSDIERLADDSVILQGETPSSYAATLLDLARLGTSTTAVGIAFARRQGLKDRVSAILDPNQPRKTLDRRHLTGGLITTALVFGSASVLAAGQASRSGDAAPPAKHGDSRPATRSNGYRAMLSDGRTVELLQVSRYDKAGKQTSWKPDGTPIPSGKAVPVPMVKGKPWIKAMLIRYRPLKGATAMDLSVRAAENPQVLFGVLNFSGGKLLPIRDGYRYGICYFSTQQPVDEFDFRLLIQDAPMEVAFNWKADGTTKKLRSGVKDFQIKEIANESYPGERFMLRGYKGPVTRVSWTNELGNRYTTIDSVAAPGRPTEYNLLTHVRSEYDQRVTYINRPLSEVKGFTVLVCAFFDCEARRVRIRPNR